MRKGLYIERIGKTHPSSQVDAERVRRLKTDTENATQANVVTRPKP